MRFVSILAVVVATTLTESPVAIADWSVARQWNEQLLHAISIDTARPTVHARNFYHVSAAMYDAWAAYDSAALQHFHQEKLSSAETNAARSEAISYAAYRVMRHRFVTGPAGVGPGGGETAIDLDFQMSLLGYDPSFISTVGDSPAALGNRIAASVIAAGMADGSNEAAVYANPLGFDPVNQPLSFENSGTSVVDPSHWQPLYFTGQRIDQFGRPIAEATQKSLTPYWGSVKPFALTPADRSGSGVYLDQGMPPGLGDRPDHARFKADALQLIRLSAQLDPNDGEWIDISPASRGNVPEAPYTETYEGNGHLLNPTTGLPYQSEHVRRGDYLRAISEFWADGPHSTAPPGHWNEIRNYVSDQMEVLSVDKRIGGAGPLVDDLEWDVKGMFALNAALHDAAIAAWNHKGVYDSSRPITFIRYMGALGQSSDPQGPSYNPDGLPLETGLVEVITAESSVAGGRHEHLADHVGEIAVRSWAGPIDGIGPFTDPADLAGVNWILAADWLPYQLSSFVTPPFPGYVSGHSTFSRTGAAVLTRLTGSEFFPGGLGEYELPVGTGLGFEYGPLEPLTLQWATYFDASDEASLSRLTGGIHPSADDFPGRRIGQFIGAASWQRATQYFNGILTPEPASAALLVATIAFGLMCRRPGQTFVFGLYGMFIVSPSVAAPQFVNVTSAVGVSHFQSRLAGAQAMTGGVAAGDFDGDGLVDLFFTRPDAADVLYRNTGSAFVDASIQSGFTVAHPSNGVASADIDNDGDLDLYVTGSESDRHFLYINDGTGFFTEEAIERGAAVSAGGSTLDRRGQGLAFGDYDGDGWVDVLTTDHSRPTSSNGSRLLRNLGATNPGHFADVTQSSGLNVYRSALAVTNPPNAYRFQPQFSDLDRDGRMDIIISADSRTSQLFWNNGDGTFTDGTTAAGVGTDKSGMGTSLGDYDGDGDLDWFVTAIYDTTFLGANPGNRLYRNNGNRTFTDVTSAAGVRATGPGLSWGWGTTFFDFDNDSDLDLAATNGFVAGYTSDRTTLWRNNTSTSFTDISVASGITDTGQGRGLIHVDYDADGDLDLVIANYAAVPIVYRNDGGNDSAWLRVETEGTVSNRDGLGAVIQVTADGQAPSELQVWEVGSGSSYLSQNETTAHFGLGDRTEVVDRVEVFWPASGLTQRYVEVPLRSTLRAVERLLGDFNQDGVVDAADYTVWRDHVGQTGDALLGDAIGQGGLPDGEVDLQDLIVWRANYGLEWQAPSTEVTAMVPEHGAVTLVGVGLLTSASNRWARNIRLLPSLSR